MPKQPDNRTVINQRLSWPTPIWFTTINEFKEHPTKVSFNEDIKNWLLSKVESEKTTIKSNTGGWQSDLLNPNEELKPLCDKIFDVVKNLNLNINQINIPQMWANVNMKGHWNKIHLHGHYDISGTYYIKVPENSGSIVFRDPRPGAIGSMYMNKNFDGGELLPISPNEGDLMLWPSYLDHFVEPSNSDEERISISFDIVIINK